MQDEEAGGEGWAWHRTAVLCIWAKPIPDHSVDRNRTANILEVLLTQIGELDCGLAAHLIVGGRRNADAARFGDALKSCRDIDAVSKNIMCVDDYVTDINSHTEE